MRCVSQDTRELAKYLNENPDAKMLVTCIGTEVRIMILDWNTRGQYYMLFQL